ncbi:DUF262 domain-containing protein [Exiguobacterium sp. Helios]|nr:DUF262 domain-containing protein [Exiguobacterium sp. Helios]
MILQKDSLNKYNIVDGQQRLTTLSILFYCLGDTNQPLLQANYSELSTNTILKSLKYTFSSVSNSINMNVISEIDLEDR